MKTKNLDKPYAVYNPNQIQFLQDEKRTKAIMSQLANTEHGNRGSNLYTRKKQDEFDIKDLDEYDSFYHDTRSLLELFQLMGIMPIQREALGAGGPERTKFPLCSKPFFWAYLIYILETFVVITVGIDRVKIFLNRKDTKFDEVIYSVIFLSVLVPHFLLPIASWRHGKEVAKFKNMWTTFQTKYFKLIGKQIVFQQLKVKTYLLCGFSWVLSIIMMISQYYLMPDFEFWHTFAYYHIIAMLNCFCSLWYVNCTAFGMVSMKMAKHLRETLESSDPSEKLECFRHLWVDLSHTMQQLGRAYSNMYGIYCLVIFFTTIVAAYGALSEIIDHGATYKEFGLFVIVFYCMSLLYIISNEAHYASKKVGLDFQDQLFNVNFLNVDGATANEVQMFLGAIAKNPPIMNLNGFAVINRELITKNVSFMSTYLVVLLQFKLQLLRQANRDSLLDSLKNSTIQLKI